MTQEQQMQQRGAAALRVAVDKADAEQRLKDLVVEIFFTGGASITVNWDEEPMERGALVLPDAAHKNISIIAYM